MVYFVSKYCTGKAGQGEESWAGQREMVGWSFSNPLMERSGAGTHFIPTPRVQDLAITTLP